MDDAINRTILESMSDGVLVVGFDGRILFVNRAASVLLGLGGSETAQKNYTELFMSEAENDPFNDILFNGIQSHQIRSYCEVPFRRSDGTRIELAVTSSFLRDGEEQGKGSGGIVVVFKDITESKALDLARKRVLDHLSHELKTPLVILKATLKRAIGPGNAKLGERIEQNLKRLEEIQHAVDDIVQTKGGNDRHQPGIGIEQILFLLDVIEEENDGYKDAIGIVRNEISSLLGEDHLNYRSVSIAEELKGAVGQARDAARHRSVSLELEIDGDLEVSIDPRVLNKAFLTLIKNAVEATPDGGDIAVSLKRAGTLVIVEVRDTGIGITTESKAQIFEGFYHARETDLYTTKKPYDFGAGGKGLELLRLKMFAEMFRFTIECESRRCVHVPLESMLCPGSTDACAKVKDADECARASGTTFRLRFGV